MSSNMEEGNVLHKSLMKGNVQSVTFLKDGGEIKGFVEANPNERTLNVYDGHMKLLTKEQKEELMDLLVNGKTHKQTVKPGDDGGEDIELKKNVPVSRGEDKAYE